MSANDSQVPRPAEEALSWRAALPRITLAEGPLQALKWIALGSMVMDHVNESLLDRAHPWMFHLGRIAMPLFCLVLAYNLARPAVTGAGSQAYYRIAKRLALVGAFATLPFIGLGFSLGGWWPLNILFTFAAAAAVLGLQAADDKQSALFLFLLAGPVVEFFWPALTLIVAAHAYCRRPSGLALAMTIASVLVIGVLNASQVGLVALVLFAAATTVSFRFVRLSRFFYVFYPAHLACLWLAKLVLHP